MISEIYCYVMIWKEKNTGLYYHEIIINIDGQMHLIYIKKENVEEDYQGEILSENDRDVSRYCLVYCRVRNGNYFLYN